MRRPAICRETDFRLLLALLLLIGSSADAHADTFDPNSGLIKIPIVTVGNIAYTNVTAYFGQALSYSLTGPALYSHDVYDPKTNQLLIASVMVGNTRVYNALITINLNKPVVIGGNLAVSTSNPLLATINPLPDARVGKPYSANVVDAVTPDSTYTFMIDTLANGSLPTSMTLNLNGLLTGTPFATGKADVQGYQVPNTYTFGVCAVDTISRFSSHPCPSTTITVYPAQFTLTSSVVGKGTITANPKGPDYDPGTKVTLTATPDQGNTFNGWSGSCSTDPCVITMSSNKSVTATFAATVTTTSAAGRWVGSWNWSGPGSINCIFQDGGAMSITLAQAGTSSAGSDLVLGGIQTRLDTDCSVVDTQAGSGGTMSLAQSGSGMSLSMTLGGLSFSGTATLTNNTLTGSFVRTTGGSGSFTLQRQ